MRFFRLRVVDEDETSLVLDKIQNDESFEAAFATSLSTVLIANEVKPQDFRYKIYKDVVLTLPIVIYARKNFYLTDKFSEHIENLNAAGLTFYWQFQSFDRNYWKKFKEKSSAKFLSVSRLKGCFHILIAGQIVSLFLFFLELVNSKLEKSLKKNNLTNVILHNDF